MLKNHGTVTCTWLNTESGIITLRRNAATGALVAVANDPPADGTELLLTDFINEGQQVGFSFLIKKTAHFASFPAGWHPDSYIRAYFVPEDITSFYIDNVTADQSNAPGPWLQRGSSYGRRQLWMADQQFLRTFNLNQTGEILIDAAPSQANKRWPTRMRLGFFCQLRPAVAATGTESFAVTLRSIIR